MTTKTRRSFMEELKKESVSLLEGSARPLTQIAAELGIADLAARMAPAEGQRDRQPRQRPDRKPAPSLIRRIGSRQIDN